MIQSHLLKLHLIVLLLLNLNNPVHLSMVCYCGKRAEFSIVDTEMHIIGLCHKTIQAVAVLCCSLGCLKKCLTYTWDRFIHNYNILYGYNWFSFTCILNNLI